MATARLLILGWPEGSGLAGSQALASLIGTHAAPARTALSSSRDGTEGPRRARRGVNIWGPPGQPAQCGALILAADAVISGSDPAGLRDRVQELAGAAARFHQKGLWHVRNMDLSPGYRRAIAPRGHGLRHVAVRSWQLPPTRECLFTIEEIPPFLPRKWYDDRFAGLTARIAGPTSWTSRHLRRLASLKLAEMTAGEPGSSARSSSASPRALPRDRSRSCAGSSATPVSGKTSMTSPSRSPAPLTRTGTASTTQLAAGCWSTGRSPMATGRQYALTLTAPDPDGTPVTEH